MQSITPAGPGEPTGTEGPSPTPIETPAQSTSPNAVHSIWAADRVIDRWLWAAVAFVFGGLFLHATLHYWAPAHQGVDQNGYLVGGKQFARTGSMGLTPEDPYGFVGRMWIGTPTQTYYPKYPLGLPFLYAVMLWIGGAAHGVAMAHLVSPITMALAVVGTFFLIRQVVPGFYALLGTIVLASSPVTLHLATNPNSHASTLFCVVWGMALLLRWWRSGGIWTARTAGLLLGYAVTIRYTEGLLILPILLVILFACFPRRNRGSTVDASTHADAPLPKFSRLRQATVLLAWWALPIAILVTFNLYWFGDITGYDSTNESTGFHWTYFLDNWETMIRQLDRFALFLTLPLGVFGLVVMLRWQWRLALVLASWVVPGVLLYTAYYWAPDGDGVGYMRFFLTFLPALVLAAMWLLHALVPLIGGWLPEAAEYTRTLRHPRRGSVAVPLIVGAFVLLASIVPVFNAQPHLENSYRTNYSMAEGGRQIRQIVPAGSVLFAPDHILHHLQFIADYRFYSPGIFSRSSLNRLRDLDPDDPQGLQPQRAQFLVALLDGQSDQQLIARQLGIIYRALSQDQRVFFIGNRATWTDWRRRIDREAQRTNEPVPPERERQLLAEAVLRSTAAAKELEVTIRDRWSDASAVVEDRPRSPRGARWRQPRRVPTPAEWLVIEVTRPTAQ